MRKPMALFAAVLGGGLFILSASSRAADYPVLNTYKQTAEKMISAAKSTKSAAEVDSLAQGMRQLTSLGVEILHLYAQKNPVCFANLQAFLNQLPKMEMQTLAEVESQYHDGKALPQAPRHCYFGRAEAVHPIMNLIRIHGGWNDSSRDEVIDELTEVIEHLDAIQKNLDQPPAH